MAQKAQKDPQMWFKDFPEDDPDLELSRTDGGAAKLMKSRKLSLSSSSFRSSALPYRSSREIIGKSRWSCVPARTARRL